VVAHIRHVYTNYDRLLRIGSYADARAQVEQKCLELLVGWRGSDENGARVLEDVFREVIVISDDEDSDEDYEDEGIAQRDSSIEIISRTAMAHEVQTRPIDLARSGPSDAADARYLSEDEAPTGYRIVPAGFRKRASEKRKVDRRGFSRYQAWDQAFDRYRRQAPNVDQAQSETNRPASPHSSHTALRNLTLEGISHQHQREHAPPSGVLVDSPGAQPRQAVQYVSRAPQEETPPQYTVFRRELPPPDVSCPWLSGHSPITLKSLEVVRFLYVARRTN